MDGSPRAPTFAAADAAEGLPRNPEQGGGLALALERPEGSADNPDLVLRELRSVAILPTLVEAVTVSVFLVLLRGLVGQIRGPVVRPDVVQVGHFHAFGAGTVDKPGDDLMRPDGYLLAVPRKREMEAAAGPGRLENLRG